jgi:hypothetical protein
MEDGCLLGCSFLEAARTSEKLVNFYQTTRRYNPEDSHLRTHRRENLKSYIGCEWVNWIELSQDRVQWPTFLLRQWTFCINDSDFLVEPNIYLISRKTLQHAISWLVNWNKIRYVH